MGAISMQHAIDLIKGSTEPFELKFVRSSGPKAGSIKVVMCTYGAPNPKNPKEQKLSKKDSAPFSKKSFKLNGVIPLTEVGNRSRPLTPLISHFIEINGHLIKH